MCASGPGGGNTARTIDRSARAGWLSFGGWPALINRGFRAVAALRKPLFVGPHWACAIVSALSGGQAHRAGAAAAGCCHRRALDRKWQPAQLPESVGRAACDVGVRMATVCGARLAASCMQASRSRRMAGIRPSTLGAFPTVHGPSWRAWTLSRQAVPQEEAGETRRLRSWPFARGFAS
jgi:hypothetical protein